MSDATTVLFGLPGVRVERVERWGRRHAGGARGDWGGGGGVPIVWGVLHVGESASDHEPKDIPYAEDRIIVRWCKTRWRCREDYCVRLVRRSDRRGPDWCSDHAAVAHPAGRNHDFMLIARRKSNRNVYAGPRWIVRGCVRPR